MTENKPFVPVVTIFFAVIILGVTIFVTGFLPTEEDLEPVWWDEGALERGEWWRAVTAIFAHAGILHLMLNLVALVSFGPYVERDIGSVRFALLYLGAAFAALIAHAIYRPELPVVGASGAIFGILGLLIILAPRLRMTLFFVWDVSILMFGALYAAFVPILLQLEAGAFIAHEAHLGGMVFGIGAAFFMNWRRALSVAPAAAAVFALVTLIVGAWARLLRRAACAFLPDPIGWLGCVLGAFWADTMLVVGTLVAIAGIVTAYVYLHVQKV